MIAVLTAILFPVFAQAREKARQTVCLSNARQIGLAILQYVQDNNDTFPNGIRQDGSKFYWPGEGWAGQCRPYLPSLGVFHCPSDRTPMVPDGQVVSYGYNINLAGMFTRPPSAGVESVALTSPAHSVLLFEVSGVAVNLRVAREGAMPGAVLGPDLSAASNGLDNRLYASSDDVTTTANRYSTGELGGRRPLNPLQTQFIPAFGRHAGGSNFLLADGHAIWLPGSAVSSGVDAPASDCEQDNVPARPGCAPPADTLTAAGAEAVLSDFRATFSVR
jgi:prepilin-type processing-associated H-X9-DG protein